MAIRVVLVDDHQLVVEGITCLLDAEDDMVVAGAASDGRQAQRLCREVEPDVVVLDVAMPGRSGVVSLPEILDARPGLRVLALGAWGHARKALAMFRAGASGYAAKQSSTDELARGIREVHAGRRYIAPEARSKQLDRWLRGRGQAAGGPETLTQREKQVLQLLAEGRTSSQLARELHISEETVTTHRKRIRGKLGMQSLADLTKYAIRTGLTTL
jgi:DNA-binding NarL/FixJ family response regulator